MTEKLELHAASSTENLRTLQGNIERFISGKDRGVSGVHHNGEPEDSCFSEGEYELGGGRKAIIYRAEAGCEIDVTDIAARHHARRTSFNLAFVDFGHALAHLHDSTVPQESRLRQDTDRIRILGFTQPRAVVGPLERISAIADLPVEQVRAIGADSIFRSKLKDICERLHERTKWAQEDAVIVPLRGGAPIANILPVPPEKIIPIDTKRVPMRRRGDVGLGMNLPGSDEFEWRGLSAWMDRRLRNLDGKYFRILEVAVASGLTTSAFLVDLVDRGVRPSHVEIVAPVVAQQGVDFVFSVAQSLNIDISLVAGQMYYRLGDFWKGGEDSILNEQGGYVIGKATDILERFLQVERFTPELLDGTQVSYIQSS